MYAIVEPVMAIAIVGVPTDIVTVTVPAIVWPDVKVLAMVLAAKDVTRRVLPVAAVDLVGAVRRAPILVEGNVAQLVVVAQLLVAEEVAAEAAGRAARVAEVLVAAAAAAVAVLVVVLVRVLDLAQVRALAVEVRALAVEGAVRVAKFRV